MGQIFAGRNFREFSRFRDFFQEIRENFSREKNIFRPFAKINPREKLEIGKFAKFDLYLAEKWKNTPVKISKNLRIAKLNPREFLSSWKFLPAKICPNKVSDFSCKEHSSVKDMILNSILSLIRKNNEYQAKKLKQPWSNSRYRNWLKNKQLEFWSKFQSCL